MATFYFIRHGHHGYLGKRYVGRMPGVHLSEEGQAQAGALVKRLENVKFDRIYSSPLERAQETAAPLAKARNLEVRTAEELNEIDIGEWSNSTFEEIDAKPGWSEWNSLRSCSRPPAGELMLEAQARVISLVNRVRCERPDATIAFFSHGDIVKGALAHFLGVHLDLFHRIEIDPASVSVVRVEEWGIQVLHVNDTGSF